MSLPASRFTAVGAPQIYHNRRVALESRVWRRRLPFGVVEWRRPTAVLVEDAAGHSRLPIRDVTRQAQLVMIGVGFVCLIAALLAGRWASEVQE